nr:MAG TPA: hypothetical protein [Caudoviricetes sp.]
MHLLLLPQSYRGSRPANGHYLVKKYFKKLLTYHAMRGIIIT